MDSVNSPSPLEQEIDLIGLWRTVRKWRWFITSFTLSLTIIALLMALFKLPVLYRSEAVLEPARSTGNTGGLQAAFGGLFALSGSGQSHGTILNYLQSRTFKSWMINQFDLGPRLAPNTLNDLFAVSENKTKGLITISYLDRDPAFAARVVAGVIEKLNWYLDHEYVTEAKRNRIFVQQQVERTKNEMEYWESQIPDTRQTATKINREQQAALIVYTELRKQYELARVEEAREIIAFKVLDPPVASSRKALPNTGKICALTFVIAGFLSIFLVFSIEFIRDVRKKAGMERRSPGYNESGVTEIGT